MLSKILPFQQGNLEVLFDWQGNDGENLQDKVRSG